MTLKREGGTFSFSLRISEGYSGTAIAALAVPTRVRLTLTHAIWPTYKLGHLIGFRGGTERTSTRWISIQTDRSLQMTNMPFCLFSQGAPNRQSSFRAKTLRLQHRGKPSGFNTEGCRGGVALVRAPPPAPVRLDQFGNRARTGGQDEWRVPFVQYPTYDRSCHTSQSAHCNLCGNDQTSTHAVLKWSGVAAALVNPLYLDISRTTMPHRLSV